MQVFERPQTIKDQFFLLRTLLILIGFSLCLQLPSYGRKSFTDQKIEALEFEDLQEKLETFGNEENKVQTYSNWPVDYCDPDPSYFFHIPQFDNGVVPLMMISFFLLDIPPPSLA